MVTDATAVVEYLAGWPAPLRRRVDPHPDAVALLEAGILQRAADGRIEFPYDAVKVEFLLSAA